MTVWWNIGSTSVLENLDLTECFFSFFALSTKKKWITVGWENMEKSEEILKCQTIFFQPCLDQHSLHIQYSSTGFLKQPRWSAVKDHFLSVGCLCWKVPNYYKYIKACFLQTHTCVDLNWQCSTQRFNHCQSTQAMALLTFFSHQIKVEGYVWSICSVDSL